MTSADMQVEVAYALPERQIILSLQLPQGSTLTQAVTASGLLQRFPDIDLATVKLGIFGKIKQAGEVLRDKDRVEIYRPLIADPKEVRRKRAAEGKKMRSQKDS
ncbi:RnfH family protein [Candidatus Venteria ishoeyi]|uniref:RnfH family protein n=1 Tax=Candidatus Venteria ishoeyi TaxID=1899563 RepID=UPI0025A53C9A|nr:RnfH family protein [Candidatus Venteria ishoeyi]MDM8547774.1 RnfH family protein [Candidatus Venteria ishoeyi]